MSNAVSRALKLCGLGLVLMSLAVGCGAVISCKWCLFYESPSGLSVSLNAGALMITWDGYVAQDRSVKAATVRILQRRGPFVWRFYQLWNPMLHATQVPLVIVASVSALTGIGLLGASKYVRRMNCVLCICGYPLNGLPIGVGGRRCPECGHVNRVPERETAHVAS